MPYKNDHLGYYSALGVSPSATAEEIKKAFKAKAQELHPDRNHAADATERFQLLNEAFRTVGDTESRAKYDADSLSGAEQESADADFNPIICSVCGKISAQPRYAIFRQVTSFVFFVQRHVSQGVFCSECAARTAYRCSLTTWALGWWGFPWGPIWSATAIFRNMLGGEQPTVNNFKVIGWQSLYFATHERLNFARALASAALEIEKKITYFERRNDPSVGQLAEALQGVLWLARAVPSASLPSVWGPRSKAFRFQALGAAAVITALCVAGAVVRNTQQTAYQHVPPSEAEVPAAPVPAVQPVPVFNQPLVPYPKTGVMRALWGKSSRFELAPLKVVTAANSSNYYVKLVDAQTGKPTLVIFIRSGATASVEIPVGKYDFRYAAGEEWYGEEFLFGPRTTYARAEELIVFRIDQNQILGHVITLIKQADGNLKEARLAPADF